MAIFLTDTTVVQSVEKSFSWFSSNLYLGSLLFNIFINDIFPCPQKYESANYCDDCTTYSSEKNINDIMTSLNHDFSIL